MDTEVKELVDQLQKRIQELEEKEANRHLIRRKTVAAFGAIRSRRHLVVRAAALAVACGMAICLYAATLTAPTSLATGTTPSFTANTAISATAMNSAFSTLYNNIGVTNTDLTALYANDTSINTQLSGITSSQWTTVSSGINYASGYVGIGMSSPAYALDIAGNLRANKMLGKNSLTLSSYATVQPTSNVYLSTLLNDRDAWIYLDGTDTASNWGIYHRQIDSAVSGLPANSIGFIGGGNSSLKAFISLADGSGYFAGNVGIGTKSPSTALDVEGGMHMKWSGSTVQTITPDAYNTITHNMGTDGHTIFAINGDYAANDFLVLGVSYVSTNSFQFYAKGGAAGNARINWFILE
jgi:hypothetical protein